MEGMYSAMFPMPVAPGDIDLELKFSQLQLLIGTDPLSPQMWNPKQNKTSELRLRNHQLETCMIYMVRQHLAAN